MENTVGYIPMHFAPPAPPPSLSLSPMLEQRTSLSRSSSHSSSHSSRSGGGGGGGGSMMNVLWAVSSNDPSPPTSPLTPIRQPRILSSILQQQHQDELVITTPQNHRCCINNNINSNHHNNATPRTYNGKRLLTLSNNTNNSFRGNRYSFGDTNSSSASLTSSSFDCQSLQHSLKRVRLSSSPGELRLQSDLRQLVLNGPWEQVQEDTWSCPSLSCSLERSSVDPLCLLFIFRNTAACALQFPRMYPHQPPILSQMNVPTSMGFFGANFHIPPLEMRTPMGAPYNNNQHSRDGAINGPGECNIVNGWLPTMQLSDVLDYVLKTMQLGMAFSPSTGMELDCMNLEQPSGEDDDDSTSDSNLDLDNEEDITMMMAMTTAAGATTGEEDDRVSSFLPPNRFDVGYRRSPGYFSGDVMEDLKKKKTTAGISMDIYE